VTYADSNDLPDILSVLADRTNLTRATLASVLTASGKLYQFKDNPQKFIDAATAAMNTAKEKLLVDGVKYVPIGDDRPEAERWYSQSMFTDDELAGYVGAGGNIPMDEFGEPKQFKKSIFEALVSDSKVEQAFADQLESDQRVKLFVKLPTKFEIPTPLGNYRPDWAAVIESDGHEALYFVLETKDKTDKSLLRPFERLNIDSAFRHFRAVKASKNLADLIYPAQPIKTMEGVEPYLERTNHDAA
jgi:type III restriction enzyme